MSGNSPSLDRLFGNVQPIDPKRAGDDEDRGWRRLTAYSKLTMGIIRGQGMLNATRNRSYPVDERGMERWFSTQRPVSDVMVSLDLGPVIDKGAGCPRSEVASCSRRRVVGSCWGSAVASCWRRLASSCRGNVVARCWRSMTRRWTNVHGSSFAEVFSDQVGRQGRTHGGHWRV